MSTVMMKLSAVGKRMEKVPESPDPSPSKVLLLAKDLLAGQKQRQSLQHLATQTSDSMSEYIPILTSTKKRVNVSLFKTDKSNEMKKGKGRVKKSKKE